MQVIEKIRTLRELNNLSQEELASRIHMSRDGYAKIERGERGLDVQRLFQIADALNTNVLDLLSITDKSELYLVNDNHFCIIGKDTHQASYHYNADEQLKTENEKLKLIIQHKDELLVQKEYENQLLKDLIDVLKSTK